ncbi:MAG: hypothetical protein C0617_13165 [Desulfuromonas sp.]|uniref:Spy/CpxP family protein refolding chaperone n=1 Tax=Desulfuromonas sp. TaxID=892 RepID=UPI000CAA8370|nr:Spy/CpxP family protein refolding chaperone [Desulfuromonas sp.]PLX82817.1 MAG: hypothetical protein C0617_13165 [Desulfuromonas sp.]
MKNRFFITALALMTAASGGLFISGMSPPAIAEEIALAEDAPMMGRYGERGRGPGHRIEAMAEVLELSEEQQAQIEAVMAAEREATEPYREQMRQTREELRETMQDGAFDEARIRALAARQAAAKTEMIVSKARTHSKIFAFLTPEQQVLAKKLRPLMGPRKGPRHFMH